MQWLVYESDPKTLSEKPSWKYLVGDPGKPSYQYCEDQLVSLDEHQKILQAIVDSPDVQRIEVAQLVFANGCVPQESDIEHMKEYLQTKDVECPTSNIELASIYYQTADDDELLLYAVR